MSALMKRLIIWGGLACLLLLALILAFMPRPVRVDLFTVTSRPMTVTVDAEGQTRVHDTFILSAPVAGRMRRINLDVGDAVVANETVVAEIEPGDPTFLDPRSASQARAAVQAAESASDLATAELERANAELEFATAEYQRARRLFSERTITRREADEAERFYKTAVAAVATANAALQVRRFELSQAQAQLLSPEETLNRQGDCPCIKITAPVNGTVLQVPNNSARVVQAGEMLLQIGDPADLEIAADFLSADAVRIAPGMQVYIDNWGGDAPLEGIVRRVEPFGFTKVSALGIEEQRVNVIIDLTSPRQQWIRLGHGYQVDVRVVLWQSETALAVPLTALFRDDGNWALFRLQAGRAVLQPVELGRDNGLVAQVLDGVEPLQKIVLHPSDRVAAGTRIKSRAETSED